MGRIKTGGNVETPTLKFPGTNANDSIVIQNTLGSEVPRLYNDYRCRFNGDTTILGNTSVSGTLYSTGPVTCNQTLSVGSNLTVTGNVTIDGSLSTTKGPWFCAGRINTGTGSIFADYGRVSYTVVRNGQASVTITMASAHPQNGNYVCLASSSRAFTTIENSVSGIGMRTSTTFQIVLRNADFTTLAGDTNSLTFMVV